ncbi:enoyl-CoA hydratase-related protein [Rhodococcus sp. YH3-3]|uniref:enoyl-CoA hydratase-related protein n=1 Tax=Rhodococcus sp. YH3-3 TaxID=1803579 RepID=UPI0007DB6948|nr:enoyl-CoA hydratase-related protein [Rhodococcus sp. YH3-3]
MSIDQETEAGIAARLYVALGSGDRDTLSDLIAPDFVGQTTDGLPLDLGGTHETADAMRINFWGRIAKNYRAQAEPKEFHLLDDGRLFVSGRYKGEGRVSGAQLDAEFNHVLTFAGGRITGLHQLTDSQRWHEALVVEPSAACVFETIEFEIDKGVAVIRLNRPDQRNAIDLTMGEELLVVARRCASDSAVRAVLIEGAGPDLTVGGDIAYFTTAEPSSYGELFRRMTGPFHEAFRVLSRINAPIVTAAHGSVAGGGLGFLYTADITLAAEGTKFVTAFAGIGLSGDGGGTWHLPRLVGARRAAQMYLENYVLGADEALEWGLINAVVPLDTLHEQALARAKKLAQGPTMAFGGMRALLRDSWTNTLSEQLLNETEGVARTGNSCDARNAIGAFMDKRRPTFEGQ